MQFASDYLKLRRLQTCREDIEGEDLMKTTYLTKKPGLLRKLIEKLIDLINCWPRKVRSLVTYSVLMAIIFL